MMHKVEYTYHRYGNQRVKVDLVQWLSRIRLSGMRLHTRGSVITKDRRVDVPRKTGVSEAGICTNPVIARGTISMQLRDNEYLKCHVVKTIWDAKHTTKEYL